MENRLSQQVGHSYPAITVRDSALVHAGDVNYYREDSGKEQEHKCHQVFKTSIYEDYKDRNPTRVDGTCQWVLLHPQFIQWRQRKSSSLLWISADPGCGKSVLAKSLVDYDLRNGGQLTVCYFFFKDNAEQDSLATALCAMLHQLFSQQPRLLHHAMQAWESNGVQLQQETRELWRILQASATDREASPVVCVFDALDECKDRDRRLLIELLCRQQLNAQRNLAARNFKVLVTSRPYDNVERWFETATSKWPHIRIRGEDENDDIHQEINLVIEQQVRALAREFDLGIVDCDRLRQQLLKMQHRTYLWLHLAMEEVREMCRDTADTGEIQITSLPASVEDAYERILSKIKHTQRAFAHRILLTIVGSRRPLSLEEMACALCASKATEQSLAVLGQIESARLEKQIREQCGLFVFINHSQLFLIHQTAKEFLIGQSLNLGPKLYQWKSCLEEKQIEREMTAVCVTYLCLYDMTSLINNSLQDHGMKAGKAAWSSQVTIKPDRFFNYCAENWILHLRDDFLEQDDNLLRRASSLYMADEDSFQRWFRIMWRAMHPSRGMDGINPLHVVSMLGHSLILRKLLETNISVDTKDGDSRTALHWAAEYGHREIVQMLLEQGADVNAVGGRDGSALCLASANGHKEVVQLLLDAGANVDVGEGSKNALWEAAVKGHVEIAQILLNTGASVNIGTGSENALYQASAGGYEDLVRLLIDAGAEVDAGRGHENALWKAAANDHTKMAQILLSAGANVNTGARAKNALYQASMRGHEKMVQMLLDASAGVDTGQQRNIALSIALQKGHANVVQMLLDAGADVGSVEEGESELRQASELCQASKQGLGRMVQLLLDAGADVNARSDGNSAIFLALSHGHDRVVQMLLDAGVDVNTTEENDSLLRKASERGHEKLVRLLLSTGVNVNVNAEGGYYGNALQAASKKGHENIVQLLLDAGADVDARGGCYNDALQAASATGNEKAVRLLLDAGAGVNSRRRRDNALYQASEKGHEKVVQILLDAGDDIDINEEYYGEALRVASAAGNEEVVKLLLHVCTDMFTEKRLNSAMYRASARGHEEVVRLLLEKGANVNAKEGFYGNALQAASAVGSETVVLLLLKAGADVNSEGGYYGSALHAASMQGSEKVVQVLLCAGADISIRGGHYGNALNAARAAGSARVVQMLLDADANFHAGDGYYGNKLRAGSTRNHKMPMQLVLERGAKIHQLLRIRSLAPALYPEGLIRLPGSARPNSCILATVHASHRASTIPISELDRKNYLKERTDF